MGVLILFRKIGEINPFRELLHKLIEIPGDELILSSGFVAEGKTFSLLDHNNLQTHIETAIKSGNLNKIIVRAGRFPKSRGGKKSPYRQKYENFVKKLKFQCKSRVSVKAYVHTNWHAKVALRVDKSSPIAALIGSSNLTTTAYGTYKNNFNRECDVAIWEDTNITAKKIFTNPENYKLNSPYSYILVTKFEGPNTQERLRELYEELTTNETGEEI